MQRSTSAWIAPCIPPGQVGVGACLGPLRLGADGRPGRIRQGRVVVDLCHAVLNEPPELRVAEAGPAMDDQWHAQPPVDLSQALEVEPGFAAHAPMHCTDGDREEGYAGLLHVALGLLRGRVDQLPGVALRVLALDPGHVPQLAFHRDPATLGHLHHGAGAGDVLR